MKENNFQQVTDSNRPSDLPFEFLETKTTITVVRPGGTRDVAAFAILWMTVWTGGCVFLSLQAYVEPNFIVFILAAVFWIFWLIVGSGLIWILIGKESLRVDSDQLQHKCTALIPLTHWELSRQEMVLFREHQSEDVDGDLHFSIELVTNGEPLRFLKDVEGDQRQWLIHRLNLFYGLATDGG